MAENNNNIFAKWDSQFNTSELKNDYASKGKTEYVDVPDGDYEVKLVKGELKPSKKGDPMVSFQFKVLTGEYKGQYIFYNQVVTQGFQLSLADDFMRSMETGLNVEFDTYPTYANLILDVVEEVESQGLEFALLKTTNEKGYTELAITEVFETK